MKKIIPKMNFNKKDCKRILFKIFFFKRLLFIILFGALLIFTFDIIYKYAFLNVKYIDYVGDNSFIIKDGKITNVNLNRILKNMDKDERRVEIGIRKEYKNPFEFDYEIRYEEDGDEDNEDDSIELPEL